MRPERGIATDGAHSMKRGVTRYRAVDLATGELLFEQNIGNQTINIGEFLGVVEAAKYIIEHHFSPAIIYTDSLTALTWFNEKRTASRKRNSALGTTLFILGLEKLCIQQLIKRKYGSLKPFA